MSDHINEITDPDPKGKKRKLTGRTKYASDVMREAGRRAKERAAENNGQRVPTFVLDDPHPGCQHCKGNGHITYDFPKGHPYFGELFPCPFLPPIHEFFARTGLNPHERNSLNWGKIKVRENVLEAVEAVKKVLDERRGMVYLFGGYGLAKTLILKVAVAEWLKDTLREGQETVDTPQGMTPFRWGMYTFMETIIDQFRANFEDDRPSRSLRQTAESYNLIPLLAIDEVGVGTQTDFSQTKQFFLINHRYEAAIERGENLITLMASNHTPAELPGRVRDRLTDGRCKLVELTGESYRLGAE